MPQRYMSEDEDSARWSAIDLRDDDIVVSTRSKHGTTWVQAILLMLVHGPDLPAPLAHLSPWVDHVVTPIDDVATRYAAQGHRRVLKTHTPPDGLPRRPGVRVVVVARHPLDAALSLYHQGANLDRDEIARRSGAAIRPRERPTAEAWLHAWVHAERDPHASLDSLQGVAHHLGIAWRRRGDDLVLVHFADLLADLPGQVERLAARTGLDASPDRVAAVAEAAAFGSMRDRADAWVPDDSGVLRSHAAFFRGGRSGDGVAAIMPEDLAVYRERMAALVPADLFAWLHR